jgi:ribosomal protein S18 acetylase RimI-like enzyme
MVHLDLPQVVRISQQTAGLRWTREDFGSALRAIDTVGHVAENAAGVVGFLIYKVQRDYDNAPDEVRRFGNALERRRNKPTLRPLQIDLVNLSVAPEWQRRGIGQAMLAKLDLKIQREPGCIRAMVPETNLAAQLFLRTFGYKAARVLRNYFAGEDGYLMERWTH